MINACMLMPVVNLALLNGDEEALMVLVAIMIIFVAVIIAVAAKKNRQGSVPGQDIRELRELAMTYVHIPQSGGGIDAATSASSKIHPIAVFWFMILLLLSMVGLIVGILTNAIAFGLSVFFILFIASMIMLTCLKVADQWDHVIVLHMGKYKGTMKAGPFFLIPFADTVAKWVDTRVKTADLLAEETLTKDTVPVDVDAVMFWLVYDAKKAALEVEKLESAVTWAAQTALRDLIGKTDLAQLLVGRDVLDSQLQEIIDSRTEPWGVTVQSVEIREIKIPKNLQESMSRQAQAERERQARVILGESEKQIAASFADASEYYINNPTALHLRAMNMLFEGLKEKGSLMIVPSSAIDSMNLGGLSGMASMGMQHHANMHQTGLLPVDNSDDE
jgi:regulator of protease activity HflC (stomatin/prohibitin superfamily)